MSGLRPDGYTVNGAILNADKSQLLTWSNLLLVSPLPPAISVPNMPPPNSAGSSVDKVIFGTNHIIGLQESQAAQGIVRLWDTATLAEPAIFQQARRVIGAGWNSDETRILIWDYNSQVHLWD